MIFDSEFNEGESIHKFAFIGSSDRNLDDEKKMRT